MKTISSVVLFPLALCILLFLCQPAHSQEYLDLWHSSTSEDFYEIQEKFNEHFEGRDKGRGSGYRQFKRWEYFVIPSVFTKEMCGGLHAPAIATAMIERGLLVKDPEGKSSVRETPPGYNRLRLYHLLPDVIGGHEEEDEGHPDTDTSQIHGSAGNQDG